MKDNYTRAHIAHMALGINITSPHTFHRMANVDKLKFLLDSNLRREPCLKKQDVMHMSASAAHKDVEALAWITFNEAVCFCTARYSIPVYKGCYT